MNIADFVLIAFLGLMLLIGISVGFVKMAISFLSGIVSFVIAVMFARPIADILNGFAIFDGAKKGIENFFIGNADSATNSVSQTINSMSQPQFIKEMLLRSISDTSQPLTTGAQALANDVFRLMLIAIAFIVVLIILRIIFFLIGKVIEKSFSKIKILNATNRILGAAFSLLQAALIIYIVLGIISLAGARMPGIVAEISQSAIVSRLYYNNLLMQIFF